MPNSYRNPNVSYRKFSFYELNGYDIDLYHGSDSDREDDDDKDNQSDSDFCDDEKIVQNPGSVKRKKSSGETTKMTWKFKKLEADDNICRSKCLSRLFVFKKIAKSMQNF